MTNWMGKAATSAVIAALAAVLPAGSVLAEDLEFLIINDSDADIVEFQVSDPESNVWNSNLIPEGYVLPSGNEIVVIVADGRDICEYDLRAVWDDGGEYVEYDANLCDLGEYTFVDP